MMFIVSKIPSAREQADGRIALDGGIKIPAAHKIEQYYTTVELAEAAATALAIKFPTMQFGVFTATKIFETTTPKVLQKEYNNEGELVVKKD